MVQQAGWPVTSGSVLIRDIDLSLVYNISGIPRGGGVWGVQTPPEIPKALQNRAKLNPICENC